MKSKTPDEPLHPDIGGNRINQSTDLLSNDVHESRGIVPVACSVNRLLVGQSENHHNLAPVVLHVRCRAVEGESNDFCAIFNFPCLSPESNDGFWRDRWPGEAYVPARYRAEQQLEQSVLVRVLEISEHGKKGREFWVRSIVRLEQLENCSHRGADAFQPPSLNLPIKTGIVVADREHEHIVEGRRILAGFRNGDGIDKVVQSAAKIMDAVRDHKRPTFDWSCSGSAVKFDENTVACRVGISLIGEAIRLCVTPSPNFTFNGLSVFRGAV